MEKSSKRIQETAEDHQPSSNFEHFTHMRSQTGSLNRRIMKRSPSDSPKQKDIFEAAAVGDLDSVKFFITEQLVSVDVRAVGSNETPLFKAVQGSHLNVIEYLINAGASVNHTDKWGYNCLLWAVDQNQADVDIIKYLVGYGADIKLHDKKKGYTALHWAAFHDNLEIVKYLIEQGADVYARSNNGEMPTDLAAQNSALSVIDYLIEDKRVTFDIFAAATKGYTNVVRFFIERKGKRVDSVNDAGWSALHVAALNGHLDTVQFLVEEKNANVNIRNGQKTPLTPLHAAAQNGHLQVVQFLVGKGANFNSRDRDGRTPLYWAADTDRLDIVRYLVDDKKANVNQRDYYDNTLLHAVTYNGHLNVLKYLVEEKKMDVNLRNNDGLTPLCESLQPHVNRIQIYQYLIRVKGVDVKTANNAGDTPMHFAAQRGYLEIVKALVAKGADVNAKQRDGRTPLYWAADGTSTSTGRLNVVKYFIDEKKCDPKQRDNYGNTLLHAAEWNGSLDVVKYLVEEKGLDVNVKDNDGNTPLSESIERGKTAIVQYLQSKGARPRRRRSAGRIHRQVDDSATVTSSRAVDEPPSATNSASRSTCWLGGTVGMVNSVSRLLLPSARVVSPTEVTSSVVSGFALLVDVVARQVTGVSYKQPVHESLLSVEELIARRFDYDAIAAIKEAKLEYEGVDYSVKDTVNE